MSFGGHALHGIHHGKKKKKVNLKGAIIKANAAAKMQQHLDKVQMEVWFLPLIRIYGMELLWILSGGTNNNHCKSDLNTQKSFTICKKLFSLSIIMLSFEGMFGDAHALVKKKTTRAMDDISEHQYYFCATIMTFFTLSGMNSSGGCTWVHASSKSK